VATPDIGEEARRASWVAISRRRKAAPPRPSARLGERCRIDAIDRFSPIVTARRTER
jgi:hypothetical protein